jgi:ABC-2 type transport system permease protein
MTRAREISAIARVDLAEVLRSRWLIFCGGVYLLLFGMFVLVGMRESSLYGFTGLGRVLLSFTHALVMLLPLLALTASGQAIGRARDDGSLELLLGLPIRRSSYFLGVTLVRYLILLLPLALLLVITALVGRVAFGQVVPWTFLGQTLVISAALLAAFVGIGLAISTFVRHQARATMYLLLAWALGVALLDFGLIGAMLRWRVNPQVVFLLASINPVQSARLALLSGLSPDLGTLGPVGFYLSTRVGGGVLFGLGTLWPLALGAGTWALSFRRFRRGDAV